MFFFFFTISVFLLFHRVRVLSVSLFPCSFSFTVPVFFFLFHRLSVYLLCHRVSLSFQCHRLCVLSFSPSLCSFILFHRLRVLSFFIVSVFFLFSPSPSFFFCFFLFFCFLFFSISTSPCSFYPCSSDFIDYVFFRLKCRVNASLSLMHCLNQTIEH